MLKIGVTGNNGSGKDTFANYLVTKKSFTHISLSEFIREETLRQGITPSRENLHNVGNEMRAYFGPDILASRALQKMANHRQNYVLTSIRNPFEVEALQNSGGFILVAITAPIELRFARIIARHRNQEETMTLEEFKRYEEKELQSASSVEQQLNECVKIARFTISNDTDLISFEQKIEQIYQKILEINYTALSQ